MGTALLVGRKSLETLIGLTLRARWLSRDKPSNIRKGRRLGRLIIPVGIISILQFGHKCQILSQERCWGYSSVNYLLTMWGYGKRWPDGLWPCGFMAMALSKASNLSLFGLSLAEPDPYAGGEGLAPRD